MKKLLGIIGVSLAMGSAYAQMGAEPGQPYEGQYSGDPFGAQMQESNQPKHMLQFNSESLLNGIFSLDNTKVKGKDADTNSNLKLDLNYAYLVHPNLQVGIRGKYLNGLQNSVDQESYGIAVGGIWNFIAEDITNTPYFSAFVGWDKVHTFGELNANDENHSGTLAFGKRISLESWGLKHVVYSPEIALYMVNGVTDQSLDYSTSLEFRFLQFSVLF